MINKNLERLVLDLAAVTIFALAGADVVSWWTVLPVSILWLLVR